MTHHVLRCRLCGSLLRKQAKNVLFLGRKRKQFYVWSPLVLQVLHAVHTLPPLSSWHWPKVAVHVFMWLVPKPWWLDQMKGCFYLCATCVEKVPLTELVLHGWLEINEWTKEATANIDLWSTNAKPPSSCCIMLTLRAGSQQSCLFWPETMCWLDPEWTYWNGGFIDMLKNSEFNHRSLSLSLSLSLSHTHTHTHTHTGAITQWS